MDHSPRKKLKLQDTTATAQITLWPPHHTQSTPVGQALSLTNIKVNLFQGKRSLSTTTHSKLTVSKKLLLYMLV
jgi:hypothetical protein